MRGEEERATMAAMRAIARDARARGLFSDPAHVVAAISAWEIGAAPVAVLVPVGILERAAAFMDQARDAADAGADAAAVVPADLDAFARALYAAGRGETVAWEDLGHADV